MTGRPSPGFEVGASGIAGVQTFSDRQSSLCGSDAPGSDGLVMPGTAADCGAIGPKVDASRTLAPRVGLQRGAPPQRAERGSCVRDPGKRPQILAPDAPESPLSNSHDTVHVCRPYGRTDDGSIEAPNKPIHEQRVNTARTRDGTRQKRGGCRKCHYAGITLLRRGSSELSEHGPQAGSSCQIDDGRRRTRRAAVVDGHDERWRNNVDHDAWRRAQPIADQLHAVASQSD